jgi:hypothetical protein
MRQSREKSGSAVRQLTDAERLRLSEGFRPD